jgi:2-polyprenyl-3-methyl-5-hydroxy-6-metoxy-1,4-benzoquinol methylase
VTGQPENRAGDRAGKDYWQNTWANTPLARTVDPSIAGIRRYLDRRFDRLFAPYLRRIPQSSKLIEVGCANSGWLPYFAKKFGFDITGLDYSPLGCQQTREILEREHLRGDVLCTDLFHPPADILGSFDIAVSLGLVEHFEDTTSPVTAIARLVRPGGLVLTTVPNLSGVLGPLQRLLNRSVFNAHVPLTADVLAQAHARAGLLVLDKGYLAPIGLGICNVGMPSRSRAGRLLAQFLQLSLRAGTVVGWLIDDRIIALPASRAFAGYAYCVAIVAPQSVNSGSTEQGS